MQLFYTEEARRAGTEIALPPGESHHLVKVLRGKKGKEILITDGMGALFKARITAPHPTRCRVHLDEKTREGGPGTDLHIAIAPTKNIDRLEFFVEKATELGISAITPVLCRNSERRKLRTDRLKKVALAAMKQSLHYHLPRIDELTDLEDFIKTKAPPQTERFVAHCRETGEKFHPRDAFHGGNKPQILIGPEGDFTSAEVELALKEDFRPLSLGKDRYRTETAGIVACVAFQLYNSSGV